MRMVAGTSFERGTRHALAGGALCRGSGATFLCSCPLAQGQLLGRGKHGLAASTTADWRHEACKAKYSKLPGVDWG